VLSALGYYCCCSCPHPSLWLIKGMGRWSSDAYQTYLHCPSNLICSVLFSYLPTLMQRNSHRGSLTTLPNQYYKISRLYPILYAMHAYHILSISPQSFAWAIRMIPKVVWQHTTFVITCVVYCYHLLLCCALLPFFACVVH